MARIRVELASGPELTAVKMVRKALGIYEGGAACSYSFRARDQVLRWAHIRSKSRESFVIHQFENPIHDGVLGAPSFHTAHGDLVANLLVGSVVRQITARSIAVSEHQGMGKRRFVL